MRRRLITSTLAVVLVVIAVFGVSLVIVETRTIENSASEMVDSEAVRLLSIVENRLNDGEKVNKQALSQQIAPDRYALVEIHGEEPIEIGTRPTGKVIASTQKGDGETVTVEESRRRVSDEIGRTLLVILAVALLAVLAAVALAVRQAQPARQPPHRPRRDRRTPRLGRPAPAPPALRGAGAGPDRRCPGLQCRADRPDAHRRAAARGRRLAPAAYAAHRAQHAAGGDRRHRRRPGDGQGGGDDRAGAGRAPDRCRTAAADQRPRPAHRLGGRLRRGRRDQAAGRGMAARLPQRGPQHHHRRYARPAGRRHPRRGRPGAGHADGERAHARRRRRCACQRASPATRRSSR